jgi:transglutaminase-like putative cysteine protease
VPGGLIKKLRQVNRPRRPEDSVALRAAVLGAVMTGTLAVAAERAISPWTAGLITVALPLAYVISYRRRAEDNWHVKIALAAAALMALLRFLGQMRGIATLDEVRFPLADLFLWVQVLHSFDLPARKDLHFSLASSMTLLAIAGSISQDLRFGVFALVYFGFAIAALVLAHRSELQEGARASMAPRRRTTASPIALRELVRPGAIVALAATAVFLVMPQPTSARTFALPFSLGPGGGSPAGGGIVTPGFSGEPSSRSSATSYYGFAQRMDLRVRGELSDDIVMRVRASAPAMWKGMLFDSYDGASWEGDLADPTPLTGEPPYGYPPPFRSLGPRARVTQTYYIEAEQPNVVFAAGQPEAVWIEGGVGVDELGALRTPATLGPGTVYSVVSSRGAATPHQLRGAHDPDVPETLRRYLQLPATLPERVEALARRVTRAATNDFDRVVAIESYLRRNYRYAIDSPVPPPGRDAVDHFLFDAKIGFCEQFASATAVMLRTLGIPARVVAGYAVGRRNPFTGYYEVRGSDAHSWVEVWFPDGYGWYEFDPTFAVPPARTDVAGSIPLAAVLRFAADKLGALAPGAGRDGLRALLAAGLVATAVWAALTARRRFRRRSIGPPARREAVGPVAREFARLEKALAARGQGRAPPETARELLARTADLSEPEVGIALAAFERERYGSDAPSPHEARRAAAELVRLARELESPAASS